MKQMIIVRTDLNMSRGKEISQGAHASLKAVFDYIDHPNVEEWMDDIFTKIALGIDGEKALLDLYEKFKAEKYLPCSLIRDSGKTEFGNILTYTAIALGPAKKEDLDPYTSELKLR